MLGPERIILSHGPLLSHPIYLSIQPDGNFWSLKNTQTAHSRHKTCLSFFTILSHQYKGRKLNMPTYNVYRAVWWAAPGHQAIFVETESDGSGELYHVVGSMNDGFKYEMKKTGRLETSRTFSHKDLLGKLESNNKPRFATTCQSVPAPGKTVGNTLQDKDCKSWVRDVIAALKRAAVLSD